ncbi:MAG: hypothetical protein GY714_10320 [Desulfobacterales bacterium]|nr:hypothetical protein [Desulfobacterales bacterium]MCP4162621.1 hypothetical protein [Deltaproteobacteria bacterium]
MKKEPIYVVSGYMRSGTSMMMKCLKNSGMNACYNKKKDDVLNKKYERDGYRPNPEGFYELGRKEFKVHDFAERYAGKLIKVLHWRLETLPEANYRVIFMKRDPKEIEVSYLKMFQRRPPFVLQKYEELVEETVKKLKARDIDVILVNFKDVIDDCSQVFKDIQLKKWPVSNIENVVKSVNRKLYRSKAENLNDTRKEIPNLRIDLPDNLVK